MEAPAGALIAEELRPMEHSTDQQPVKHPRWCARGPICLVDGIHHSKPLTATSGDAYDALRLWLEQGWTLDRPSIVIEATIEGDVHSVYLPLPQARILVHQVRRLLDAAKGGRR